MFSDFECTGKWFLPDNTEDFLIGTLTCKIQDNIRLELTGSFHDSVELIDSEIILGISSDGQLFTLIDCLNIGGHDQSVGGATRTYSIHGVLKNAHFTKKEDLKFNMMWVNYNLIEEWLGRSGFKIEDEIGSSKVKIEYENPEAIEFQIRDSVKGKLSAWTKGVKKQLTQKDVTLKQINYFALESEERLSINRLQEIQYQFQNFLTLATGEAVFPLEFIVDNNDGQPNRFGQPEFVFIQSNRKESVLEKFHKFMLFRFPDIEKDYQSILKNWFEKFEELSPVFYLLFDVLYKKSQFTENTFLSIVQALETFHRYSYPLSPKEMQEHQAKMDAILSQVEEKEHLEWLKSKLHYSYEPSLRKRLNALIDKYGTEVFLALIKDQRTNINHIVLNRNYYTHFDKSLESKKLPIPELMRITDILTILLISCILIEIGFDKDQVNELYKKGRLVNHLVKKRK